MRFLHFTGGFAEQEIFNRLITRPLKNGDPEAAAKLQLLMSGTCLRRRKDMEFAGRRIVQLPSIQEYVHSIGTYPYPLLLFSSRFVLPFGAWFLVSFPSWIWYICFPVAAIIVVR